MERFFEGWLPWQHSAQTEHQTMPKNNKESIMQRREIMNIVKTQINKSKKRLINTKVRQHGKI